MITSVNALGAAFLSCLCVIRKEARKPLKKAKKAARNLKFSKAENK